MTPNPQPDSVPACQLPRWSLPLIVWGVLALLGGLPPAGAQDLATNTPSRTPTPAPTATALPPVVSVTVINQLVNVRAQPNRDAEVIATASRGTNLPLLSQTGAGSDLWFQVSLPNGDRGWVFSGTARRVISWPLTARDFDGVTMVLVPPGCFVMGSRDGEADEAPAATQCFQRPFWIDRTEVTNGAYGTAGYFTGDERPRESVTWAEASAFCAARDARLPTEAEWEYAARGPDSLIYPWGNEFVDANAVSSWLETQRTTDPVASRPGGVSWVGAYDMAGNVWEWTSSLYAPYPYDSADGREDPEVSGVRVVRGGACCSYIVADVRSAYRFAADPNLIDPNIGFRCARDA